MKKENQKILSEINGELDEQLKIMALTVKDNVMTVTTRYFDEDLYQSLQEKVEGYDIDLTVESTPDAGKTGVQLPLVKFVFTEFNW